MATPFTGAPRSRSASSGPALTPMSMLSAASACCSRAPPPTAVISTSRPCRLKIPWRTPMSSGRNANASATALPTRSFSCADACAPMSSTTHAAATTENTDLCAIMSSPGLTQTSFRRLDHLNRDNRRVAGIDREADLVARIEPVEKIRRRDRIAHFHRRHEAFDLLVVHDQAVHARDRGDHDAGALVDLAVGGRGLRQRDLRLAA